MYFSFQSLYRKKKKIQQNHKENLDLRENKDVNLENSDSFIGFLFSQSESYNSCNIIMKLVNQVTDVELNSRICKRNSQFANVANVMSQFYKSRGLIQLLYYLGL